MKIAVTCENMEIDGLVPALFKESEYLMIIDADKNEIFKIYGKQDPDNMVFAEKVLEHDCEAIICGQMEKDEPLPAGLGRRLHRRSRPLRAQPHRGV